MAKWEEIKETCRAEYDIIDISYNIWIRPLTIYDVIDHTIYVVFQDKQIGQSGAAILEKKYGASLTTVACQILGEDYHLVFIPQSEAFSRVKEQTAKTPTPALHPVERTSYDGTRLNPRYTFDTFVVGNNNSLAHAAALAVAEAPGVYYNPLFIYGGVGLGKTHLMQSIAHFVLEQNPSFKVQYVTSERFTNELIEAIRNENSAAVDFRNRYRNVDMLLIDDIQFIIGKERTQEEFFHTFNTLYELKKQIIISSDKPPKDIETLEERLRSRFEWGLTVDIQSPDYETRMAILRKKEELDHLQIDDSILEYIASHIQSNIRELEGALTKVVAASRLKHEQISLDLAVEALRDLISPSETIPVTPDLIIQTVAAYYDVQPSDLLSSKKSKNIALPRQVAMYLCRLHTTLSLEEVGNALGGRDHTTVIHGVEKIETMIKTDPAFAKNIEALNKKLCPASKTEG